MTNFFVISFSFIIALILTLLPMPEWAIWLKPLWVLLVLIYWNMTFPQKVNVGVAFLMGLILDVLNGNLLGQHAFAFVIISYFVVRIHTRLRMFLLLQQGIVVFLLLLLYQFILFCIQGFVQELPRGWLYWSASLTSTLLWPWVFTLLRDCRRRFRMI